MMVAALLAVQLLGQAPLLLRNQSGYRTGFVTELNCVGAGVSCSSSGPFGVIFVDGGSGAAARAVLPLYVDAGYVNCTLAAENTAGCVAGTAGQVQAFSGIKLFKESASFAGAGSYVPAQGLYAGIDAYNGIATGGPVFPNTNGLSLGLFGRRLDTVPNVYVGAQHWVDGGTMFAVNFPVCGFSTGPMFAVTTDSVIFGGVADRTCAGNGNLYQGALVDNGGNAGHMSMYAGNKLSLSFAGNLQANIAIETDGGRPYNDGGNPEVCAEPDGGAFYCYAGRHGQVIVTTMGFMKQGLLFQADNKDRPEGNHVFYVTHWGSFGQDDQVTFTNFPVANVRNIPTSGGQYITGFSGELAHDAVVANTENTGHWRNRHIFADAGAEWVTMVDTSQIKSGTCTLDGASPAKCSVTLPRPPSGCNCSGIGFAAIAAAGCAYVTSGYTATFYSSNGSTHDVGFVCF